MDIKYITGRNDSFFKSDIKLLNEKLYKEVSKSRFLVLGGAGTIGQATVKEIFKRQPKHLSVVDLSENNLVELVRDIRSSFGYGTGTFETLALDIGSVEFSAYLKQQKPFDYVLNFSALKHVRSESNPFTLVRMIKTNILNSIKTIRETKGSKKYFCVSTDKASNPVNMMGASKRIMELFMKREAIHTPVSMARFANVAFSDGSLLHGFKNRLSKRQPLSAPQDVKRYFISSEESGELCLLSCIFGENLDIFFPKLSSNLHLKKFSEIAIGFLVQNGYEAFLCKSEEEARGLISQCSSKGKWPCYFFNSDTTGEKHVEEFYTQSESVDWSRFKSIGVIRSKTDVSTDNLDSFERDILSFQKCSSWEKPILVELFKQILPEFSHLEAGKYLDQRM